MSEPAAAWQAWTRSDIPRNSSGAWFQGWLRSLLEDLQGRVAMAETGVGDGVIVLGHHQVAISGEVDGGFVVEVGVGPHPLQFDVVLDPAFVDGHQLLVQVVEDAASVFSQFWNTAT